MPAGGQNVYQRTVKAAEKDLQKANGVEKVLGGCQFEQAEDIGVERGLPVGPQSAP